MGVRRVISIVLAIVGAFLVVIGIILVVAGRTVFDQARVQRTTLTIMQDKDVNRLLTREITTRVVTLGGLDTQRAQVQDIVTLLLADDQVRTEVVNGVMAAYDTLVNGSDTLVGSNDTVVFNLVKVAHEVRSRAVTIAPSLDAKLPGDKELLRFDLFRRTDLPESYTVIDHVRHGAWWMLIGGALVVVAALALGPGRFSLFALASATVVVAMFVVSTLISSATDKAINAISDPLTRRVARLATDGYVSTLDHVAVAVVIFGLIAVVAGVGGSWIKNALWPVKPKVTKVREADAKAAKVNVAKARA